MKPTNHKVLVFLFLILGMKFQAQQKNFEEKVLETMLKATGFMVEDVSTNGGYVWYYLPDFYRQWGEMHAYTPISVHRRGSNIKYGNYYVDQVDRNLLSHYYRKGFVNLQRLKDEYKKVSGFTTEEATKSSLLIQEQFKQETTPQRYYDLNRYVFDFTPDALKIEELINALDDETDTSPYLDTTGTKYISTGIYIRNMKLLINYIESKETS